VTIPRALKPDYATGLFGKWHLGHVAPHWPPTVYGFDAFYGLPYSHDMRPLSLYAGRGTDVVRQEGRVDMAITAGADLREFESVLLREERFFLVCRADHELAAKRSVGLAQLAGRPMVHLARSSSVRQQLDAQSALGAADMDALEVEHLATVAGLVREGLGVSVVPELTLFHFRREGLRAIPLRDKALRRPIVLARRKAKALSIAARAMWDEIVQQARV